MAIGQIADPANVAAVRSTIEAVLDVARRKSGYSTIRWPLEVEAALPGCAERGAAE